MLYHITLMSKQFIVVLGRDDQIDSLPVRPVHQIIAGGKRIECLIFTRRLKSREIEHHIHITHLLDMCISCNCSIRFMRKDWISRITFPGLHILGKSDADTFSF